MPCDFLDVILGIPKHGHILSFCYVFANMSDVTYVDTFLLQTLKLLDLYKRKRRSALLVTVEDFVWLPLETLR